ncbi:MAG: bifunctional 2-polyprenyl-6-hydroxyphenol methylase/3-demethylubiquinol 3-O-methyltransferase UbiG, partial [Pseudomonadota bacterium]|nr:bifunctional 2-polyprenyl-6-hydroxyphenol methylase/3-demethylubiquinol 3-O-methyltransferase UbiG [Pseudomonadota bacterium]
LNRSLMSLLGAKIFAEYLLKIVPVGTHDWRKFIKPSELNSMLRSARFTPEIVKGISYSISEDEFRLATNPVVNYAVSAFKC